MSRATIHYDMKQLSGVAWNVSSSKLCYICKRCSAWFETQLGLQRHKIECFMNHVCQSLADQGHGQFNTSKKSKTVDILSPRSAIFAASAVPPEYCRARPEEITVPKPRALVLKSNSTDSNQTNIVETVHAYSLRSGRRRPETTKLKWSTSSCDPDTNQKRKNNQNASKVETGSDSNSSKVVRQFETTVAKKPQGPVPRKTSFSQLAAEMYSFKGYKIPKLKSGKNSGSEIKKTLDVDDGIVPDLVPPPTLSTSTTIELAHKLKKDVQKILLEETSDYASNSSNGDCDSSSGGGDVDLDSDGTSKSRKSSPTPQLHLQQDFDGATCSASTDLPSHFEINEECVIKSEFDEQFLVEDKIETIHDMEYYVIIKSEDELEYVDIFTEDDGGVDWNMGPEVLLLQEVDDGQTEKYENCSDQVEQMNVEEIETESQSAQALHNENHSHYENENETQEMLDLELGAVETVIESDESFGSKEGEEDSDFDLNLEERNPISSSVAFPKYAKAHSSHTSSKTSWNNSIQTMKEKTSKNFTCSNAKSGKSTRKLHSTPTNLLTSVLEKTLLIRLRRCDGALTSMPKLKRMENVAEQECLEETKQESSASYDEPHQFPVEIPIPSPEIISPQPTPPIMTQTAQKIETSYVDQSIKRKHSKEEREQEDKWDIVADLSESNTSTKCPIKLKIKRRRLEEDSLEPKKPDKPKETIISHKNTSSPQFFDGSCKICGSNCSYRDAKTYYTTSNASKPFCCCTCFDIFNQEEWSAHNKVCYNVEEFSFLNENPHVNPDSHSPTSAGDSLAMERDFICPNCFKSMSKC